MPMPRGHGRRSWSSPIEPPVPQTKRIKKGGRIAPSAFSLCRGTLPGGFSTLREHRP
jgi:hypothetical protein